MLLLHLVLIISPILSLSLFHISTPQFFSIGFSGGGVSVEVSSFSWAAAAVAAAVLAVDKVGRVTVARQGALTRLA